MKAFLVICLAAAVYAQPEADPLMVYGAHHVPSVYNTVPSVYNTVPSVYNTVPQYQHVAQPFVQQYAAQPLVQYVAPMAQRATVHQTPELEGPGGKVAAKTAVAGDITSYTLYHGLNKRDAEAESDPAVVYANNLGYYNTLPALSTYGAVVPSYYNQAAYNVPSTYIANPYAYNHGLRVVKREADSEADPALFYRSAYGTPYVSSYYNNAAFTTPYVSSVQRPVVSSPFYSALGYRQWY